MKHIIFISLVFITLACSDPKAPLSIAVTTDSLKAPIVDSVKVEENRFMSDTAAPVDNDVEAYDELVNPAGYDHFTISPYNEDADNLPNIRRPAQSSIKDYPYSKERLFGVWVQDPGPDAPHATFELTDKSFYVVDYDGDGDMPYEIVRDSIRVYYNDFIQKGKIMDTKHPERLMIHWEGSEKPTIYYTWKN